MSLSNVVRVIVSRQTRPVTQAGFGVPLLFSLYRAGLPTALTSTTTDVRVYTPTDDYSTVLGADSLETNFLNRAFGQTLVPPRIYVGAQRSGETVSVALNRILNADDGFYVICPVYDLPEGGNTNVATEARDAVLRSLLDINTWASGQSKMVIYQDTDPRALTSQGSYIDITPVAISLTGSASATSLGTAFNDASGSPLRGALRGVSKAIGSFTAKGVFPAALGSDILMLTDKFVVINNTSSKRVRSIEYTDGGAQKIENISSLAVTRPFGPQDTKQDHLVQFYPTGQTLPSAGDWEDLRVVFTDGTIVPIETLGSELFGRSADRAAVFWTKNQGDNIHAAVVGRCFPAPVGSITFAYKTLNGVPVSSDVSTTAATILRGKNINYYITIGGRNVTLNGITSGGEFIDIIRTTDWLSTRIQENVFTYLANAEKIPYTDEGAEILVNAATEILEQAVTRDAISPTYTIATQSILDVPLNDRANRRFGDININARVNGAIHTVDYNLTISV